MQRVLTASIIAVEAKSLENSKPTKSEGSSTKSTEGEDMTQNGEDVAMFPLFILM